WLEKDNLLYRHGSRVYTKSISSVAGTDLCNFGFPPGATALPLFALDDTYFYRVVSVSDNPSSPTKHSQRIERMARAGGCNPNNVDAIFTTPIDDLFAPSDFAPLAIDHIAVAGGTVYVHLRTPESATAVGYKDVAQIVALAPTG